MCVRERIGRRLGYDDARLPANVAGRTDMAGNVLDLHADLVAWCKALAVRRIAPSGRTWHGKWEFAAFAKWYAENKAAGRTVGEIMPAVEDYGDAKAGAAATGEVRFEIRQGDKSASQCLVFAWIEGSPRKDPQAFSCDDVAGVEKWKTDRSLKSAWR